MRTCVQFVVAAFLGLSSSLTGAQDPPKRLQPNNSGGISDASGAGAVTGIVKFKGEKPEPRPINEVAGNAFCKQCYKDTGYGCRTPKSPAWPFA